MMLSELCFAFFHRRERNNNSLLTQATEVLPVCLRSPQQHAALCVMSLRRWGANFERHAVVPDERARIICIIMLLVCSKLQINAADAKASG